MARFTDLDARERLLAAATEIFVERGLDRAKVEDITARAALSKGSFYLHFTGKEAAFRQVVETIVAKMAFYVEAALRDDAEVDDLPAYFERRIEREAALFEFLWTHRAHVRLLLEGGKSAAFGYLMDEFADRARENAIRVLERGVIQGIYRADFDVELASIYVAGAYDRLARHVVKLEERPDFYGMLRLMQRLVLRGLGTEGLYDELSSGTASSASPSTRLMRASLL
jgi:AcrR family transcriptional regulator